MSTVKLKLDEDQFQVYYDPTFEGVVMKWKGYFTSEQFREGSERMFKCLKKYKVSKVLGLIKEMTLISNEDQKWLDSFFLPKAVEHGFGYCALLRPENYFNRVAIENVTYKVDDHRLQIRIFDSEDEAREWLKTKKG